jgi:hypothetical protein
LARHRRDRTLKGVILLRQLGDIHRNPLRPAVLAARLLFSLFQWIAVLSAKR